MELKEFIAEQKQLLDDFVADYERKRKKKSLTMFRRPTEWDELYGAFKDIYEDREGQREREPDEASERAA